MDEVPAINSLRNGLAPLEGWVARGGHAPARDPSDEYDGGHPIRIGLGDGVEGSAKAPFIMGVSGELERSA